MATNPNINVHVQIIEESEEEEEEEEENEEEEEEEEEDEEEPKPLHIDGEGRIEHGGELHALKNNQLVTVWDGVIPEEEVTVYREMCKEASVKKKVKRGKAYSRGQTYWVAANRDEKTLTGLEHYVKSIFDFHSKGTTYDANHSGAEWWSLVLDTDSQVGWHWDKDYALEGPLGLNIYPQLGTVTYLTTNGSPTVVAECVAPPPMTEEVPSDISSCFVCYPRTGRHLAFDGRFLHGATDLQNVVAKDDGEQRVTLLVNVWLNHKPLTAVPFRRPLSGAPPTPRPPASPTPATVAAPAATPTITTLFQGPASKLELNLNLPKDVQKGGCVYKVGPGVGTVTEAEGSKKKKRKIG